MNPQVEKIYKNTVHKVNSVDFYPILKSSMNFRENLLIPSEWCEEYLYLPSKITSNPGRLDLSSTPFLRGILNTLNDDTIKEVSIIKSTQVGISLTLILLSMYIISQKPANIMFTLPDLGLCREFSGKRLQPLMNANKKLIKRHLTGNYHDIANLVYNFKNMFFKYSTANSPAQLASSAVKYLFIDEIDKFPQNLARESDPISLARERLRTFKNSKIYLSSTPTNEDSKINYYFENSNKNYYYVPCIHCNKSFNFIFSDLKFPKVDNAEYLLEGKMIDTEMYTQIYYQCPNCSGRIYNNDKLKMIKKGEWIQEKPYIREKVGFHINAFLSRYLTFADIAYEFVTSKNEPDKLRNFKNSWLGEIFNDSVENSLKNYNIEELLKKQSDKNDIKYTKGQIPDEVLFLVGGVDVQDNTIYNLLVGVAPNRTFYIIDWREFPNFYDLESYYENIKLPNNKKIGKIFIDSRWRTPEVYDLYKRQDLKNNKENKENKKNSVVDSLFFPIIGTSSVNSLKNKTIRYSINKRDNVPYADVNTEYFKDQYVYYIKENKILFPQDVDEEFLSHLKAEHKVRDPKSGNIKWQAKYRGIRNDYFDCLIYSLAAVQSVGYYDHKVAVNKEYNIEENKPQQKNKIKKRIRNKIPSKWLG